MVVKLVISYILFLCKQNVKMGSRRLRNGKDKQKKVLTQITDRKDRQNDTLEQTTKTNANDLTNASSCSWPSRAEPSRFRVRIHIDLADSCLTPSHRVQLRHGS